ncbi:MAG: heparan-alpha-glucosaminide N-acetyltransferase domain-containing protein, partial [Pseudomonadota bacterium]
MPHISTEGRERINALDALRGLAALLMMEQHLGIWLWKDQSRLFKDPFMLCFNGLGGLAAPLFVVLAGMGAALLPFRHESPASLLMLRGLIIMAFGYMLNLLTPSWFSPGTWYVLHMIGFALIISPALLRLSPRALLASFVVILIATLYIHYYLKTPFPLSSSRMRNTQLPGGVFRLALAEGHFPIFPWLDFFIAGLLAGTWRRQHKNKNILYMAAACLCAGGILAAGGLTGFSPAAKGLLLRACK